MERKKRQKRNTIIDKAEKIMAKKGYWDMTMDEVAEDADVAKGTIYLYFNSKEALCAAVMARNIADMNRAIKQKLEGIEGGSARLMANIRVIIEWNMAHPEKSQFFNNVMNMKFKNANDPNVREFIAQTNEQLQVMREDYELAIAEGTVRADLDPLPTAMFMRMVFWIALNPFASHELVMAENGVDRSTILSTALDIIYHATRTEPPKHAPNAAGTKRARVKS